MARFERTFYSPTGLFAPTKKKIEELRATFSRFAARLGPPEPPRARLGAISERSRVDFGSLRKTKRAIFRCSLLRADLQALLFRIKNEDDAANLADAAPTSGAADRVAQKLGIPLYETPTGWKFFGNLLDAGQITLCGEESFGTGSDHVREKDGLWAVLFWLQILAKRQCSVAEIMADHWKRFGRHYYSRHDYEAVDSTAAHGLYDRLEAMLPSLKGQPFAGGTIRDADNFSYTDPIDHSVTKGQGLRILLEDGSRVVIRLSGTGTKGATIRVYLESYVANNGDLNQDPQVALGEMIRAINALAEIEERTGMKQPTVIT